VETGFLISCGTLAGAVIPELVKFSLQPSRGMCRKLTFGEGMAGASLGILSAWWPAISRPTGWVSIVALMSLGYFLQYRAILDA